MASRWGHEVAVRQLFLKKYQSIKHAVRLPTLSTHLFTLHVQPSRRTRHDLGRIDRETKVIDRQYARVQISHTEKRNSSSNRVNSNVSWRA